MAPRFPHAVTTAMSLYDPALTRVRPSSYDTYSHVEPPAGHGRPAGALAPVRLLLTLAIVATLGLLSLGFASPVGLPSPVCACLVRNVQCVGVIAHPSSQVNGGTGRVFVAVLLSEPPPPPARVWGHIPISAITARKIKPRDCENLGNELSTMHILQSHGSGCEACCQQRSDCYGSIMLCAM